MGRMARVAVPGYCYHITHRGNRRSRIFFEEGDQEAYCGWLKRYTERYALRIWAWCLMTNHIHLVAEPMGERSLARALGHGHGKYAQWVNARYGLSGHLWQGRFFSAAMDEEHLWQAVRYVELNPVRAGLVADARDWLWSSARAHISGQLDELLSPGGPLVGLSEDWGSWLRRGVDEKTMQRIRLSTHTGRPCGDSGFVQLFEEQLNRLLQPQKPGPKRRLPDEMTEDLFA
jgi:putative transposase